MTLQKRHSKQLSVQPFEFHLADHKDIYDVDIYGYKAALSGGHDIYHIDNGFLDAVDVKGAFRLIINELATGPKPKRQGLLLAFGHALLQRRECDDVQEATDFQRIRYTVLGKQAFEAGEIDPLKALEKVLTAEAIVSRDDDEDYEV